eukprot:scaffold73534_cov36-Tisochrysis_lutea.AAC.1
MAAGRSHRSSDAGWLRLRASRHAHEAIAEPPFSALKPSVCMHSGKEHSHRRMITPPVAKARCTFCNAWLGARPAAISISSTFVSHLHMPGPRCQISSPLRQARCSVQNSCLVIQHSSHAKSSRHPAHAWHVWPRRWPLDAR